MQYYLRIPFMTRSIRLPYRSVCIILQKSGKGAGVLVHAGLLPLWPSLTCTAARHMHVNINMYRATLTRSLTFIDLFTAKVFCLLIRLLVCYFLLLFVRFFLSFFLSSFACLLFCLFVCSFLPSFLCLFISFFLCLFASSSFLSQRV